ncbi:hypothetical protein PHMEG_00017345 [Phytophthora megakarya]|uniref:Uncharacterized protein n=1 Tax=Phytophthora megakarya TaxID=4795 RepID=A0A225VZ52_9STRA|nr:hypothetical protein PHMEG_00017345 [Phytophthora megakarya]
MTSMVWKQAVPTYAQHERRSHAARSTKGGYVKPKCRKRRYMRFRAPMRDSACIYRGGMMKVAPLSKYKSISKVGFYSEPSILRVGKSAVEAHLESQELYLMNVLVDLTALLKNRPAFLNLKL